MSEKIAIMPYVDYKGACDEIRDILVSRDLIKSGELRGKVRAVYERGIEVGGGNGECNHQVYDLSHTNSLDVHLKSKIERPTSEQIALFNGDNIVFVPDDVEHIAGITRAEYLSFEIAESMTVKTLNLVMPIRFGIFGTRLVYLYYVWEEDIDMAKSALESMGIDVSSMTGEGWFALNETTVEPITEEDRKAVELSATYECVVPYGDYWDSLFDFRRNENAVDMITEGRAGYAVLLTSDTLCENDIAVRTPNLFVISHTDESGLHIDGREDETEYQSIMYIDVQAPSFDAGITLYGCDFDGFWRELVFYSTYGYSNGITITATHCVNGIAITPADAFKKIETVYTNATIVSQSEDKVYISGLRHNTHIVVNIVEATE